MKCHGGLWKEIHWHLLLFTTQINYKVSCNLSYGTQRKTRAVLVVFAVLAMLGDHGESFDKQLDNNIIVSCQADATKMRYWE